MSEESLEQDKIITGDCLEVMRGFAAERVDLTITSPPYLLLKEYESKQTIEEYLAFMLSVMKELYRITKIGGRVCWNIPNQMRRNSYGELWSPMAESFQLLKQANFRFFDLIIWNQGYADSATAWGSWRSPSAPFIRHQTESILVFYKGLWKIQHKGKSDLEPREFMSLTKGELWDIKPETNRENHPAPFPIELPSRCIKLFSYIGDVVLDPFCGSGTTAVACHELKRRFIGIEINSEYAEIARARIKFHQEQTKLTEVLNSSAKESV